MHRIAIPVTPGMQLFELAIPCEVFEPGREDFAVPWWYELQLCAVQDGPVRTAEGLLFDSPFGLDELSQADTVIIPGCADRQDDAPEALLQALRTAYDRGARIASICTGAFILAAAGLLDGRTITTHWMHADELTRRWPAIRVEPNVLYTDDGQILTSAWTCACISSVMTTAPGSRTLSPGGSSCRRTGKAGRPSTSSSRCPRAAPRASARRWTGPGSTSSCR
jgi:transcriptional regulator GlxA family with amidase domain